MTQLEIIKSILRTEGKIDNYRCIGGKISLRLGARIYDLKKQGFRFSEDHDPEDKRNFIYVLEHDPENIPTQLSLI